MARKRERIQKHEIHIFHEIGEDITFMKQEKTAVGKDNSKNKERSISGCMEGNDVRLEKELPKRFRN